MTDHEFLWFIAGLNIGALFMFATLGVFFARSRQR